MIEVMVIGAGLAGSEAAYQLAKRGIYVHLYEMRPKVMTPAHHTPYFAELVCSNSLRGNSFAQAVGVLKEEMRMFDSLIIQVADSHQVPAGGALAVDREGFAKAVTEVLKNHPNIRVVEEEVTQLPDMPVIIASGPLTSEGLMASIQAHMPEDTLYFYDAAAPIIDAESIDMTVCYKKSRYDKGTADYINCPMDQQTYQTFYEALINAECVEVKDFELKVFEGCMPIEEMARRGEKTMLFGPLKPVGLEREHHDRPHAVVQLRQDDARATLFNIVGFQTHLKFPEQKRIIRMIPGLENARIVRYGVIHRNTYLNAPKLLNQNYALKTGKPIYFAGQITGVEGYVESAASGLVAGVSLARRMMNQPTLVWPKETVTGAMADYVATANPDNFQPMNANFGLLPELKDKTSKKMRKEVMALRAIESAKVFRTKLDE